MSKIHNIRSFYNITIPMETLKQHTVDFFYQVRNQLIKENLLFNLDSLPQDTQEMINLVASEFDTSRKGRGSTFRPEEWRKKKPAHLLQKVGQSNEEMIVKKINQDLNKISNDNWETIIESIKIQYQELINQVELSEGELLRKKYILPILENIYMKSKIQPIYCPYYIKLLLQISDQEFVRIFIKDKKSLYLRMINTDLATQVENDQWQVIDKSKKRRKRSQYSHSPSPEINLEHLTMELELGDEYHNNQRNSPAPESSSDILEDYDSFCQANKLKISQQGASQFMGELFKADKTIFSKEEIYYCYLQFYNNLNGICRDQIELSEEKIDAIDENTLYFTSLVEYTLEEVLKLFSPEELREIFDKVELLSENKVIPAKQRFKIKDLVEYFHKKVKNNKRKSGKEYKKKSQERY